MFRSISRSMLLLAAVFALGACNSGGEAAKTAARAASTDPLAPDLSADYCKLLPPEQVEEYKRAHDQFHSVDGLVPQFTKGQLFTGGQTVTFKWAESAQRPLGVDVYLLRNCSMSPLGGIFLREETEGSGEASGTIYASGGGNVYPSGTPALLRVTTTEVDMQTMKGKTTVVGEYTITLQAAAE